MPRRLHTESALAYVLKGLIPYTEANLKLAFKPSAFFADLDQISRLKERTMKNAYYTACRQGLIELDDGGRPHLTDKGKRKLSVYQPRRLSGGVQLMVVFDIPERERWKRSRLRRLLVELDFKQIQKSVWVTSNDHKEILSAEIRHSDLGKCVQIYEVHLLQ
jgi:DNA-binding transcriptional regulator PaaX